MEKLALAEAKVVQKKIDLESAVNNAEKYQVSIDHTCCSRVSVSKGARYCGDTEYGESKSEQSVRSKNNSAKKIADYAHAIISRARKIIEYHNRLKMSTRIEYHAR